MYILSILFMLVMSSRLAYGRSSTLAFALSDMGDRCIAWSNSNNSNAQYDFRVNVTVNGILLDVPVDTGSTGFLISARSLNFKDDAELKKCCPPAFQFLSSSKRYYEGYWLPSDLAFEAVSGRKIRSQTPVLAVTERGLCKNFMEGDCTKTNVEVMPTGIQYMGVGFGRWSKEQPGSTAEKNPLLNVVSEGDTSLRSGYTISNQGLILGVRKEDLANGWKLTQLTRNTDEGAPLDRPEWNGIPMCVEVAESQCFRGTALFDTGIAYANLGVPNAATEHIKTPWNDRWILQNDIEVVVKVGRPEDVILNYSFIVGDTNGTQKITPGRVQIVNEHADGAFINTGRFFYNAFALIFDERSGTIGIKSNKDLALDELLNSEPKQVKAEL